MSLIIYLTGFACVIGGIAWALIVAGVTTLYVMIGVAVNAPEISCCGPNSRIEK
jgi:hypothetical protein